MRTLPLMAMLAVCVLTTGSANASVVSINFAISTNDNNNVDADESAVTHPVGQDIAGQYWNSALLRTSGSGAPTAFTSATQSGNSISLLDDTGASVATMTSSGSFYSEFSDATSNPNRGLIGDAGLVQSFINLNNTESITISGLADDFPGGYDVLLFNEAGDLSRTMGLRVEEGAGGNDIDITQWFQSRGSVDGDADDDGYMEWIQATGLTSGTATVDGNYILVEGLAADSFSIYGTNNGGRAIFNGLQIIGRPVPEPSTVALALLGLVGVALYGWRRKR